MGAQVAPDCPRLLPVEPRFSGVEADSEVVRVVLPDGMSLCDVLEGEHLFRGLVPTLKITTEEEKKVGRGQPNSLPTASQTELKRSGKSDSTRSCRVEIDIRSDQENGQARQISPPEARAGG
ncbi:UNVERIFIED_CONTAM: hypothetical protein PYX00_009806 [Menopon gallinae]|uniref:Uncharacterized protein n=1 Tax=Menopon gallinae TaxID=328185 RepID=A0AAW2HCC9_9NEOP